MLDFHPNVRMARLTRQAAMKTVSRRQRRRNAAGECWTREKSSKEASGCWKLAQVADTETIRGGGLCLAAAYAAPSRITPFSVLYSRRPSPSHGSGEGKVGPVPAGDGSHRKSRIVYYNLKNCTPLCSIARQSSWFRGSAKQLSKPYRL